MHNRFDVIRQQYRALLGLENEVFKSCITMDINTMSFNDTKKPSNIPIIPRTIENC